MPKLQGYSHDLVTRMVKALREISDDITFDEDGIKNYLGDDLAFEVLTAIENSNDNRKYVRRDNIRRRVVEILRGKNHMSATQINKVLVKEGLHHGYSLKAVLTPLINEGVIISHGNTVRTFYKLA